MVLARESTSDQIIFTYVVLVTYLIGWEGAA